MKWFARYRVFYVKAQSRADSVMYKLWSETASYLAGQKDIVLSLQSSCHTLDPHYERSVWIFD
ncbi:hypothetical protein BS50DRAFT_579781 [Corynespora cassiicola Philippines]|uniref:Uncharacterized protein n=1 Tax=Corynespora cassiicola Philippines TaxID=1448308 RepID=A0A2T2N301_CORCC|nr:hypothetical protein BS50DRAFT_579781 [Corynespora cassiicola Philippines]